MKYRLLVDLEVIKVLDGLPKSVRNRLFDHFDRLRPTPERYIDAHEQDDIGRQLEISVYADYCSHYWIDSADRHVKILAITAADR